jgi:hypothetical protein
VSQIVATPLWGKCEDEIHTPKSGNLESSGTPATSELDCRNQNTSSWCALYTVGKALKCRCRKWSRMSHLDIYNTSYGRKKGRESNRQFDSWPQKVGNRPDSGVCRWSATHRWKALEENYKFALDLIPIWGLSWELWAPKVPGVQTGTVSGLLLGGPENKSHLDAGATEQHREYYMGEGGGFPRVWDVVSQVSPCCPNMVGECGVNFFLLCFLLCVFYWGVYYVVNVHVIWWHDLVASNFVMCRSLDETYVYVIATCHVHICGKRDFYFFFHCWYFVFVNFFLDLTFLGWLVDYTFPSCLVDFSFLN